MGSIGSALTYSCSAMILVNSGEEMFASSVMQVFAGRLITFLSDFPKSYSQLKRYS